MSATLYSAQWYRIARLRPRLRAQVRARRQQWRGQRWYLLSDEATGRQHRLSEAAYQFIGRCDGQRSVQEVWSALLESRPDDAPTQDEVLALLGQLDESGLLQSERASDADVLRRRRSERLAQRRRGLLNPLSFRLPLGDPSGWLPRLDPLARWLWRPAAAWLWTLGLLLAVWTAAAEWPALRAHAAQRLDSPGFLLLMWLLYPVVKALHELGHALALRRWGAEVREVGLGLILLTPAPYVDAGAAATFARRRQRIAVSAAGIAVELALAALALGLWLNTAPGWLRDGALALMLIGVTSTLFFNGNPLLRFDGYHILCDAANLANLAGRSSAWWRALLGRRLLGAAGEPPPHAPSERKWLIAYAPLSLAWRVGLTLALVDWLAATWIGFALLGLVYAFVALLARPLHGWAREALQAAEPGAALARVRLRLGLLALGTLLLLGLLPLPQHRVAPAVVWLPEQAQLRSEVEGFVAELPQAADLPGRWLRQGERVGWVLAGGDLSLRAALVQADAARLRDAADGLSVRLADAPGRVWPARLAGGVPQATRELPSPVLGEAGGGPIPVAPAAPGEPAVQALQPVVLLDLTVPGLPLQRVGTRAWVRLELGHAPLAQQLYRQAVQAFLPHVGR
ncbi:MAG: PqqD family peptide modification chaperone [Burkholderiaceae bacterium]|nr:PqqD family peptide modification chaperone [Burkholderiaceae bacterium]